MNSRYVIKAIKYALLQLVVAIFIIMWLAPLYAMLIGGFKTNMAAASTPIFMPPSQISTEAYYFDWFGFGTLIGLEYPMMRQLLITVPVALVSVILGSMGAYYFYVEMERRPWVSNFGFSIISLAAFLPAQTLTIPIIKLTSSLGIYQTYWGLAFAYFVFYLPMSALLMSMFLPVVPKYLLESARLDGARDWATFWHVIFPIVLPGFLSTLIFVFLMVWQDFFIPLIIATKPSLYMLPVAARQYVGGYAILYNRSFAAGVITSAIPLVIFAFLGRYFIRGLAALGGGAKGV
jgi:ABC-type glycerol-3-phosphate transport system permease component